MTEIWGFVTSLFGGGADASEDDSEREAPKIAVTVLNPTGGRWHKLVPSSPAEKLTEEVDLILKGDPESRESRRVGSTDIFAHWSTASTSRNTPAMNILGEEDVYGPVVLFRYSNGVATGLKAAEVDALLAKATLRIGAEKEKPERRQSARLRAKKKRARDDGRDQ